MFTFNWKIIALQYCVGFCHTTTWITHRYTYVPSLLNLLSPCTPRLSTSRLSKHSYFLNVCLFLIALGLCCCSQALWICGEQGPLWLWCRRFSLWRLLLSQSTGSGCRGSGVMAHGLSSSTAGNQGPGIKPVSPALPGRFLTTGLPGGPKHPYFNKALHWCSIFQPSLCP